MSWSNLTNSVTYDSDMRPISLTSVVSLALSYDLANHITGITNRYFATLSQNITYDAMGRIATVASGVDNESYTYDADGNVLTANDSTLFHYSEFGNVIEPNGTWSYSAGAEGQQHLRGTHAIFTIHSSS